MSPELVPGTGLDDPVTHSGRHDSITRVAVFKLMGMHQCSSASYVMQVDDDVSLTLGYVAATLFLCDDMAGARMRLLVLCLMHLHQKLHESCVWANLCMQLLCRCSQYSRLSC